MSHFRKILALGIILILGTVAYFGRPHHTDTPISQAAAQKIYQKLLAQVVSPTPASKSVKMFFGGDVMLSRDVMWKVHNEHASDGSYLFANLKGTLDAADVVFFNLESPFGTKCNYKRNTSMLFCIPDYFGQILKAASVDVVSLANNHNTNTGLAGLDLSLQTLTNNGIQVSGAGTDWGTVHSGQILEAQGKKIGFLSYTYSDNPYTEREIATLYTEGMIADVQKLRPQVDFLVVSMHAGVEYKTVHNKTQENFAHSAVDAGADLIIGHHPHVVQDSEVYKGKKIYYSLGNLIFDQHWSEATRKGLVVLLTLKPNGETQYQDIPVYSGEDYEVLVN